LNLSDVFRIGSNYDTVYGINGYIAEIIIFNRNLTEDEQNQVNNYLNYKYQIY